MENAMTDNLSALARDWRIAKQAEDKANAERIRIEEQLSAALDVPTEGSKTHKIDGYKVTLTQPVTRKLDLDAWEKVKGKCPDALVPIKTKIEADAAGMKWLQDNEPQIWKRIASAFETKPGKIGVKVEEQP
jgi:hypothetical protein